MVALTSLWLPILLSAVFVFVASSIIHMVLGYHRSDYRLVPSEGAVMEALRRFSIPPGDYMMPRATSMKEMSTPAFQEKFKQGPVAMMTVMKSGSIGMGPQLVQWFVFCLVVSVFAAYITGRALGPGASVDTVCQFASCTAFLGYALANWPQSIWYKRSWGTTIRNTIDGLVYAFITGGTFMWFWPSA